MNLTREERETTIRKSEASDSWDVWTCSEIFKRQMERKGWPMKQDHQRGWSCEVPLRLVSFRRWDSPKRQFGGKAPGVSGTSETEPAS